MFIISLIRSFLITGNYIYKNEYYIRYSFAQLLLLHIFIFIRQCIAAAVAAAVVTVTIGVAVVIVAK